eukprot:350440-Chlamydomonas_euryale.AAC.5
MRGNALLRAAEMRGSAPLGAAEVRAEMRGGAPLGATDHSVLVRASPAVCNSHKAALRSALHICALAAVNAGAFGR